MGDVLRIVHRLRKVRADQARTTLAQAQQAVQQSHDRLLDTEARLGANTGADCTEVIVLQRRHQGALHLELRRRAEARRLAEVRAQAGSARDSYTAVARDAKVVELVAESRARAGASALARKDGARLDEQGLMSWWRRSA